MAPFSWQTLYEKLFCHQVSIEKHLLTTMPILRHGYFTTATIMRQALFATSLLWDMSFILQQPFWDMTFFLQQPLWDMTILRHDIFPTSTIMRHEHFETWHLSYSNHYERWPFRDMVFLQLHNLIWEKNLSTSGVPNNQRHGGENSKQSNGFRLWEN